MWLSRWLTKHPFRCRIPRKNRIISRTLRLLTNPNIPFGRVGDDVDIEIVPGQVASQVELLVRRKGALRQEEEAVEFRVESVVTTVGGWETFGKLKLAVCL